MNKINRAILIVMSLFPAIALAAFGQQPQGGLGDMASSMMGSTNFVRDTVGLGSLVVGGTFLFASFIRYKQYRINRLAAPLSTVITLFILGILLLGLGLAYKFLYLYSTS